MAELKTKRNLFMGVFAAVVLAAVITGGVVWAQEGDTEQNADHQGMASRVAEILNLDEVDVTAAFQQASKEMRDDRFQNRMDRLVENGKLTEEEAAEAVEWHESRPEGIGHGRRGFSMKRYGGHRSGARFGGFGMRGVGSFAHTGF